ncbi:MAG TPA: putative peptidoglycan glycosyltransferase FtsW [Treponemataceae bacterium]|nr:putative peptidoglycan glycosyltransferase FtsW [Treponemataceae bacterium]
MSDFTLYAKKPINSSKFDTPFLLITTILLSLGMVTLFASTNGGRGLFSNPFYFVIHQFKAIGFGLILMLGLIWIDMRFLRKMLPFLFLGSLVICLLTAIPGIGYESNGARRWIKIGNAISFQPSETAKFVLVIFLANLFAKKADKGLDVSTSWYQALFGISMFVLAVYAQRDFSTAMFLLLLGVLMAWISGVKFRYFVMLFIMAVPVVFLLIFTEEYRVQRLIGFFHHSFDVQGVNYQLAAAKSAISSGGFIGKGISGLSRINAIPEVQADFLFAGWAESMGFIGVLIYFGLIGVFSWRVIIISLQAADRFSAFVALGSGICIIMQSLINTGVVCGAFPSTGIPLPFFSAGGSSMIVTLCFCGLIINISRKNKIEGRYYE